MDQDNIMTICPNCGAKNRIPRHRVNQRPICGRCRTRLRVADYPVAPVDITDQTFEREVLSFRGPVLVDCWAPWCGPCRMVGPVLEQLASDYAGRLKIAKLNVDENPATASKYGIQSIPTMLLFRDGNLVNSLVGALPREEIERQLGPILT